MKNQIKINKIANDIASYLMYRGFDIDFLRQEVHLSSFLKDLYSELSDEDQEEIDKLYDELVDLVSDYLEIPTFDPSMDSSVYEHEILAPQVEEFINNKVREKAEDIMYTTEFNEYVDFITGEEALDESARNKLHEDFQYDPKDIEKTADFLRYQYNLDDYNDSYYAAIEFFGSDDWYELRKAIRYAIEELDEAFEQLSDYNNKEARDYRLRTSKLINIWNQFAAIAQEEFRNAESDDDLYTLFKAIDTDGWAISNIPHSIISKIITN